MTLFYELLPWLIAMLGLIAGSAFFSGSEAALFYLRPRDRDIIRNSGPGGRLADSLLNDPDRLLSAVLFWNLLVNITYFAIASSVGLKIGAHVGSGASAAFAFGALLTIIFCSEMLPKSVAVLRARKAAEWVAFPLAMTVKAVAPLMPVLRFSMQFSRRVIWPSFKEESYLEVGDLERAIERSTEDAELIQQEQAMLRNIVLLSSVRVEEWMRPRTQFRLFRPPVSLEDLAGEMTPSGYLLVSEEDSEDVAMALDLKSLVDPPKTHIERLADPTGYVPWCATVADALELMIQRDHEVIAVVNEFGETIGIVTFEDVLDTIFNFNPSRSKRLLDRNPIHPISEGVWLVAGVTSLRRLARLLNVETPSSKSVTVAGVIQETLGRLVQKGDTCEWGPFRFEILEAPQRGLTVIRLELLEQ